MTSDNQKNTPTGLYALSGFSMLWILDILVDVFSSPSNSYSVIISTIIFIPLLAYLGIGTIKAWPQARNLFIVVAMLLFVGTIAQIITFLIIESQGLTGVSHITRVILGLTIPPVIFSYLRKENVKSYFEPAT